MVAAITLKFLDPFGSGKLVLFQVTYDKVSTKCDFPTRKDSRRDSGLAYL